MGIRQKHSAAYAALAIVLLHQSAIRRPTTFTKALAFTQKRVLVTRALSYL
jgi:hypothetical protein